MVDDEVLMSISFLNSNQRDVYNVVHNWSKKYAKLKGVNFNPVHIFFSGSGGTGKSHFVKIICNALSKTLLFNYKEPKKQRIFLLGPTGISAVNIGGAIIHSALGIRKGKLSELNDKAKASERNELSEVKLLMVDEIYMVSSNLWT